MAVLWEELKKCRACNGTSFHEVVNLGHQYVIDFPTEIDKSLLQAPLDVIRCTDCGLVQLRHSVSKERLFHQMWYRSSISETMKSALEDVVKKVNSIVRLKNGHRVLDIGCNDGHMLGLYPKHVTTVGIDPCLDLILEASREKRVDIAVHGFFSEVKLRDQGPFKVITAIAMFYDVSDPQKFLEDCRELMTDDGLLVIQMNYLKTMLEDTTVDNISHEHLTYWSLNTLYNVVAAAGLQIQGVETNSVNGGSIRAYITKPERSLYGLPSTRQLQLYAKMQALMLEEQKMGFNSDEIYARFRTKSAQIKDALRSYLLHQKQQGAKLYIYGASTRGTALVQFLDLPENTFLGAAERDEKKYDRYMVGCWTKIMPEAEVRRDATHMLVLPYHFREQIQLREQQWIAMGGTLIFPLPVPMVFSSEEAHAIRPSTQDRNYPFLEVVQ